MNFDITWKEPTEPQLAAWELACNVLGVKKEERKWCHDNHHIMVIWESTRRAMAVDAEICAGPAHEMTPYTLAEMILVADNSLWYTQAKRWQEGKTPFPDVEAWEKVKSVFQFAGDAVVKIVDQGYKNGRWWDLNGLWINKGVMALQLAAILDATRMLNGTSYILSQGWQWFPRILMPKLNIKQLTQMLASGEKIHATVVYGEIRAYFDGDFRKTWLKSKREAKKAISNSYKPITCIQPKCENLVAPKGIKPREGHFKNYRGKDACCQGHASYFCLKCKAPHSYHSKTGKNHYKDGHWGKDWDGLDENGEKWVSK